MLPAYFTALGTQSSAATIPVTLEQTKKNGVSAEVAGFVIPLCATIHLSGSTLKIVACALALMMMQGMPFDFPLFAGFIFMPVSYTHLDQCLPNYRFLLLHRLYFFR